MPLGSTRLRFSGCARKRQTGLRSVDAPSDVAILNMEVDSQSLFRWRAPGLLSSGENGATDEVFRALLSEAMYEQKRPRSKSPVEMEMSHQAP
jgi:hypothetical protein